MSALISLDEKEQLSRLKEGDQVAFEKIYDRYSTRVFQNTLRLTKSQDIAEELLQETFYRIWEKRSLIDTNKPIKAYLFRIAENLAYDHFRKIAKDKVLSQQLIDIASQYYDHIDEMIESKENNQILQSAIAALPPKRREIFLLCKFEGKSYREVSVLLGISESTINDHIVKAMRFLKEYFGHSGEAALTMFIAYLLSQ